MKSYHDKSNPNGRSNMPTIVAINGIVVLVLIVLALTSPSASEWISAAVQSEFVGGDTSLPTQIAQPAEEMRIVRSN